jgi:hypothetical protein
VGNRDSGYEHAYRRVCLALEESVKYETI